jgi:hypothetical protein
VCISISEVASGLLIVCAVLLGCDHGSDPGQRGRINVDEGIDGVQYGDDAARVTQKLGQPTRIGYGDFPGIILEYAEGRFATMNLTINDPTATPSGVTSMSVSAPYLGRTIEGIGIGSARTSVLQLFRQPTVRNQAASVYSDRYGFAKHPFILYFRNNTVESIHLMVEERLLLYGTGS